jgi:hypothetical protein
MNNRTVPLLLRPSLLNQLPGLVFSTYCGGASISFRDHINPQVALAVSRQDTSALAYRLFVSPPLVIADVAPVAGDMAEEEARRIRASVLEQ